MAQKNETLPLILALLITAGILGGGFWWFTRNNSNTATGGNNSSSPVANSGTTSSVPTNAGGGTSPTANTSFPLLASVPAGTSVRIEGSTSMAQINAALKQQFEQKYPGTSVTWEARGTDRGIEAVLGGSAEIAAISRSLTPEERQQGLEAVPVARDAIAIVVSNQNPFQRGLSQADIVSIFTGQKTDWGQVGGSQGGTIRVLNRPEVSGTHQAFKELVLNGGNFGTTANIETLPRDETTGMLQALGENGIGYATFSQVADQQTVRVVAIDGLTPEAPNYPYQRALSYVYKTPPNPGVEAFLGYATSGEGQGAIAGQ